MLTFTADPRDGALGGAACNTCCCEALVLRPGETNLLSINYAPWSLPLYPGITPTLEFDIETDNSTCSTSTVDGFNAPSNTNYELTTPVNTILTLDLSGNAAPASNTFTYKVVPLTGPSYGTITQTGNAGDPTFSYSPNTSYSGYDYFSYEMEDAQGRKVIRHVQIRVGTAAAKVDRARLSLVPFIDRNTIVTNTTAQIVQFPIHMPISVEDCQSFKLTIKQPAKDCDGNIYNHLMCFDITPKPCG